MSDTRADLLADMAIEERVRAEQSAAHAATLLEALNHQREKTKQVEARVARLEDALREITDSIPERYFHPAAAANAMVKVAAAALAAEEQT